MRYLKRALASYLLVFPPTTEVKREVLKRGPRSLKFWRKGSRSVCLDRSGGALLVRFGGSKSASASARGMKFGVVVAEWNENITEGLFKGARDALLDCDCDESNIIRKNVPGSFELPLAAQFFFESTDVDAVICLGSVILQIN